jgi:hypothetical protein
MKLCFPGVEVYQERRKRRRMTWKLSIVLLFPALGEPLGLLL